MKIKAFTTGINRPSARYRLRQLIFPLAKEGIFVDEDMRKINQKMRAFLGGRSVDIAFEFARRSIILCSQKNYDLAIFQRPFVNQNLTIERLWRKPYIFDVDDAIHTVAPPSGGPTKLAAGAEVVVAGNAELANFYDRKAKRVEIIPTGVDTNRYQPVGDGFIRKEESIVIGWVGTSNNLPYLESLEDVLTSIVLRNNNVKLLVVCDRSPAFKNFPAASLEYIPWNPDTEVSAFQSIDIGLMPLKDGPWERGKCSFKMLQYMACGSCVVVSPVGMNRDVLKQGQIGFGANSHAEWLDALDFLICNPVIRAEMGNTGRSVVVERYSVQVVAKQLAQVIKSLG